MSDTHEPEPPAGRPPRTPWLAVHLLTYGASWPMVVEAARDIDALGYDAILTQDHLFATQGDPAQPFFEAWTTVAALAPQTRRVTLGHLTLAAPLHHPAVLARAVMTVDHASGGRALLGLGAAWDEEELVAHGIPTDGGLGGRIDRLDEALAIVRSILAGEPVTVDSRFHHLADVRQAPRPIQDRIPVLVGAAGRRKGLRVAARHADLWQTWIRPGGLDAYAELEETLVGHAADVGRDASTIRRVPGFKLLIRDRLDEADAAMEELAVQHAWTPAVREVVEPLFWRGPSERIVGALRPFVDAGIDGLVVQSVAPYDRETLRRFIGEVAPAAFGAP